MNGSVILICGKICAGKTTYAHKTLKERKGVLLSCDEIMLFFQGLFANGKHDAILAQVQNYLFDKSLDIVHQGLDVVLDWGFWRRKDRDKALDFYRKRGIKAQVHYLAIGETALAANIARRNASIGALRCTEPVEVSSSKCAVQGVSSSASSAARGAGAAYYVDDGLMQKCNSLFEPPSDDEGDVIRIDLQ